MFELLARAIMEDREREIARFALQNKANYLSRSTEPPTRRGLFGRLQRSNRASSAAFTASRSASTIE